MTTLNQTRPGGPYGPNQTFWSRHHEFLFPLIFATLFPIPTIPIALAIGYCHVYSCPAPKEQRHDSQTGDDAAKTMYEMQMSGAFGRGSVQPGYPLQFNSGSTP